MESDGTHAFPGKGHMSPEKEELYRLRKEDKRLRMEREIVKKPRPSLPESRVEIWMYPASKEGLSHNHSA